MRLSEENKATIGKKLTRQERILKYGKKKIVKAQTYKSDDQPANTSFYDLLYDTLMNEKLCAIVHMYEKQYAYISVAFDAENTGLILGVLDESGDSVFTPMNNAHSSVTTHNAHPWLKAGIEHMIDSTVLYNANKRSLPSEILHALAKDSEESKSEKELTSMLEHWQSKETEEEEGLDLYKRDANKKIYNYNLKSSKEGSVVPYSKKQTLQVCQFLLSCSCKFKE